MPCSTLDSVAISCRLLTPVLSRISFAERILTSICELGMVPSASSPSISLLAACTDEDARCCLVLSMISSFTELIRLPLEPGWYPATSIASFTRPPFSTRVLRKVSCLSVSFRLFIMTFTFTFVFYTYDTITVAVFYQTIFAITFHYFFFLLLNFCGGVFFRGRFFLYFFITLAILLLDMTTPEGDGGEAGAGITP